MITWEFIFELERVYDHFEWELVPERRIPFDRRASRRLRLRGICKDTQERLIFDPIGAVCYIRTGGAFTNDSWMEAATLLGLSLIDAGELTAAANDVTWRGENGRHESVPYIHLLRNRLLHAVGLEAK